MICNGINCQACGVNGGVVQFLEKGGSGGEAVVNVELRTIFPGIGGTIMTEQGVITAARRELNLGAAGSAHRTFLLHAVLKKLDDYFLRDGRYAYAHIPRALGSCSHKSEGGEHGEICLYEWVPGSDCFSWRCTADDGTEEPVLLSDWSAFTACFAEAGIRMSADITDSDDGRVAKNIVHLFPPGPGQTAPDLSCAWKRIDFGTGSLPVDYDRLLSFFEAKKEELRTVLSERRRRMMVFAVQYLKDSSAMDARDKGALEELLLDYRSSSLAHYALSAAGRTLRTTRCIGSSENLR